MHQVAHKQMEMMILFIVKETWFLKKFNSCSLNVLQRTSSCCNIQALDERNSARCSMCSQCRWLHGNKLQSSDWFLSQCSTSQMHQTHEVSENFLPTTLLGYMRNSVMSDKKAEKKLKKILATIHQVMDTSLLPAGQRRSAPQHQTAGSWPGSCGDWRRSQ